MNDPETIPLDKNSATWPYVLWFAELMEHKLDKKRHKGDREGWLKDNPWALLGRIREELVELEESMQNEDAPNAILEAADVANFAMMVADSLNHNPDSVKAGDHPKFHTVKLMNGFKFPCFGPEDRLRALFIKHAEISRKLFGQDHERGPEAPAAHLVKEAHELAAHPTDIMEMADVFNLLMDTLRRSGKGIDDLLDAVDAKLDILPTRKWGKPDANGVIEHIRE